MLGHGLSAHRQLLAQGGRRSSAISKQEIQHPSTSGVADCRPQLVVNPGLQLCAHAVATTDAAYGASRGMKKSQPLM